MKELENSVHCFESGWCDYSKEHNAIRRKLEKIVETFFKEPSGIGLPVVIAPYGSGKTKLLAHIEWYAKNQLKIPALRIELSSIVSFIKSKTERIHESKLPILVEEFFEQKTGSRKGVLLVDEIEEAYDELAEIVVFETSPLRGLADAVYNASIKVLPVLAFGPSSMLKEALFGPVAWRSIVLQIPLLPPLAVARNFEGLDKTIARLLGNTVWWAARGRPGWVNLLSREIHEKILPLLTGNKKDPSLLLEIVSSSELFSAEILEGTPIIDKKSLRELARLTDPHPLAGLLLLLVGPIPFSTVEELGVEPPLGSGLTYVVSRAVTRVEEVVSSIEEFLARVARSKNIKQESIEKAVYSLRMVLSAWSRDGFIIYEPSALEELAALAADLARELFPSDADAHRLLESISLDLLGFSVERSKEAYIAIRPKYLGRLYPFASGSPLLGCARRAGSTRVSKLVESLELEELEEYSVKVAAELGLDQKTLILPISTAHKYAESLACRATLEENQLLILLSAPDSSEARPPALLEALKALGLLDYTIVSGKQALLLYSLVYNKATKCSIPLSAPEQHVLNLYAHEIRREVNKPREEHSLLEELRRLEERASKLRNTIGEELDYIEEAIAFAHAYSGARSNESYTDLLEKLVGRSVLEEALELVEPIKKAVDIFSQIILPSCFSENKEHSASPLLQRILSAVIEARNPQPSSRLLVEAERVLESLKPKITSVAENLPLIGVVEALLREVEKIEELRETYRALIEKYPCTCITKIAKTQLERIVAESLENLKRVDEIKKQYEGLREMASKLPREARTIVEEALKEALIDSLREASSNPLLEAASALTELLVNVAKSEKYRREIEKIVDEIESILSPLLEEPIAITASSKSELEAAT